MFRTTVSSPSGTFYSALEYSRLAL